MGMPNNFVCIATKCDSFGNERDNLQLLFVNNSMNNNNLEEGILFFIPIRVKKINK